MSDFINGWTKEKVIKHIEENFKGRAYDVEKNICEYLTKDGKKCAVGLFIPDGHKGQKFVGDVLNLLGKHENLLLKMPFDSEHLLTMQRIHDWRVPDPYDQNLNPQNDEETIDMMISYVESLED